jgi:HD-like signal output (HDOD) protein
MNTKQSHRPGKFDYTTLHVKHQSGAPALKDRILRDLIGLPSMPHIVTRAMEIISAEDTSLKKLASVIETDPAIAAKTLKLANSAYYGLSGQISSLQHAAVLLGTRQVADFIIMAGISTLLEERLEGYGLESGDLWRHSLSVALVSRIISSRTTPDLTDDAFAAGLLHDCGKVVLNRYLIERKAAFDEILKDGQHAFIEAEAQILGVNHCEIVSAICTNWHIPEALCSAIRYCHYPSQSRGNKLAYIVHVANTITKMGQIGNSDRNVVHLMGDGTMEFIGLKVADLKHIMDEIVGVVEKVIETVTKT